jgi:hypothetical protein
LFFSHFLLNLGWRLLNFFRLDFVLLHLLQQILFLFAHSLNFFTKEFFSFFYVLNHVLVTSWWNGI